MVPESPLVRRRRRTRSGDSVAQSPIEPVTDHGPSNSRPSAVHTAAARRPPTPTLYPTPVPVSERRREGMLPIAREVVSS